MGNSQNPHPQKQQQQQQKQSTLKGLRTYIYTQTWRRNQEIVTFTGDLTGSLVLPAMRRVAAIRHDPSPPPPSRKLGQGPPETNLGRSIGGRIGRPNRGGNGLRGQWRFLSFLSISSFFFSLLFCCCPIEGVDKIIYSLINNLLILINLIKLILIRILIN